MGGHVADRTQRVLYSVCNVAAGEIGVSVLVGMDYGRFRIHLSDSSDLDANREDALAKARALTIDQIFAKLRQERIEAGVSPTPDSFQGISKPKLQAVLAELSLTNAKVLDSTFALLDDETPNMFSTAPKGTKFGAGARTSQIACHIGYLQRDGENVGKVDREGRDEWIKPLRDIGAVDAITLVNGNFVEGHISAKNPNSSYRLNPEFVAVIKQRDGAWQKALALWVKKNKTATRMAAEALMNHNAVPIAAKKTGHAALIEASIVIYAPKFLPGYEMLYKDDSDGDRISAGERLAMKAAGVDLGLADAMPDVLLWNPTTDWLWVIEAVTSDGEVDPHKVRNMTSFKERHGKKGIGFTTTYNTWRDAAIRQQKVRNIEIGTYIWILEDPTRQMLVESFDQSSSATA